MPFLPPNQQRQSTEGMSTEGMLIGLRHGGWIPPEFRVAVPGAERLQSVAAAAERVVDGDDVTRNVVKRSGETVDQLIVVVVGRQTVTGGVVAGGFRRRRRQEQLGPGGTACTQKPTKEVIYSMLERA